MMIPDNFASRIIDFHQSLDRSLALPGGVEWLYPYANTEVQRVMTLFFNKYFSDNLPRIMLLGINPGRFGAGITGLPFTDPIRMEEICGIDNSFRKRQELSSVFVYDVIDAMGGPEAFYSRFYFTSVCPLGFVKSGKNYNYYDDRELYDTVKPLILENLSKHLDMGVSKQVAFSMGQGKNFKFLQALNKEHGFFKQVHPLPHPRWVMQYRLKRKKEFLKVYTDQLNKYRELT